MRGFLSVLLGVILIALLAFMVVGYWAGSTWNTNGGAATAPVGTSGAEAARERGAELGERAATAAQTVRETVSEAGLTGKIKAKMALDDTVRALNIDVTTVGSTVTLSGRVGSAAERDRALALARETDGVTNVKDNLTISR